MRAGNRNHMPPGKDMRREPGGAGGVGERVIEHIFDTRVAAAERVPDDHEIGVILARERSPPFGERNPSGAQGIAHRGIHVSVSAGYTMPEFLREGGNPGHECAADAEDVKVHLWVAA